MMRDIFPDPEILIELEPEEVAKYLLPHLVSIVKETGRNRLSCYNATLESNPDLQNYTGNRIGLISKVICEAWNWLQNEGLLAPLPDSPHGDWVFITRRGLRVKDEKSFTDFQNTKLLPRRTLDPTLAQKVWGAFIRGDYDVAVFAAFKEVEVRIRRASKMDNENIGVKLARKAFNIKTGPLTDEESPEAEKQAYCDLFAGAVGAFKNPSSHRDVDYENPEIVACLILFANVLIKIINKRELVHEREYADDLKLQASV